MKKNLKIYSKTKKPHPYRYWMNQTVKKYLKKEEEIEHEKKLKKET